MHCQRLLPLVQRSTSPHRPGTSHARRHSLRHSQKSPARAGRRARCRVRRRTRTLRPQAAHGHRDSRPKHGSTGPKQHRGGNSVNSADRCPLDRVGSFRDADLVEVRAQAPLYAATTSYDARHRQCSALRDRRGYVIPPRRAMLNRPYSVQVGRQVRTDGADQTGRRRACRGCFQPCTSAKVVDQYHHQWMLFDADV